MRLLLPQSRARSNGRSAPAWQRALCAALFTSLAAAFVAADAQTTPPSTAALPAGAPTTFPSALPTGRATYRTLSETYNELERIAATYPNIVKRFELSHRSLLGQRMWALEISHDVNTSSGKPVFLMTGLHHAREWPTVELTMEFVWDILKNDRVDTRITSLLDSVRVIVVPIVNPDGYDMSRSLIHENKRKNCRIELGKIPSWAECAATVNRESGVDLNRNYGAFWGGGGATIGVAGGSSRGESPFSEPEIQSMRDLISSNQIVVALSNHTPDAKVLRVPSGAEEPIPADIVPYDSLAQALGGDLKWPAGPWPKIYYVATGTLEETAYYSAGTFSFTFENAPGQRSFHPAYSFVVDQYFGTGAYPGSSARAGFMRLFAAAANSALHSVLNIKAPAGATLTLTKSFALESSPVVNADSTRGAALTFPMKLTSSMVVPAGKSQVVWHVNPSVRPSQHAQEWIPESWTVTCTFKAQRQSVQVKVKRGETATVDLHACR